MKTRSSKKWPVRIAAGVAVAFGALKILSGGRVLFGAAVAQEAAGSAVPLVLWFNFLSGFVYALAGIGIAMGRRWAILLALALVAGIATVFAFRPACVSRRRVRNASSGMLYCPFPWLQSVLDLEPPENRRKFSPRVVQITGWDEKAGGRSRQRSSVEGKSSPMIRPPSCFAPNATVFQPDPIGTPEPMLSILGLDMHTSCRAEISPLLCSRGQPKLT